MINSIVKNFLDSIWNHLQLLVDLAATTILPFKSAIILWTCICVSMLYAIHLVLMCSLSTDLTVPITLRSIDSLKDLLYDPEFNHIQPVIFRQMNMYSVLKNSREGTDAHVLYEKIVFNSSSSTITVDINNKEQAIGTIFGILDEAVAQKIAIIENSNFFSNLNHILCMLPQSRYGFSD